MYLSKAFHCIPHKLLIAKFRAYGMSEAACRLMASNLRDRKQRVKIGNEKGEWLHVCKGTTAQGSILGPFCYNVFTNDLLSVINGNTDIYNYADDNTLICSGYNYDNVKRELISSVEKVMVWFEENYMQVNPNKFQCIFFGKVFNL